MAKKSAILQDEQVKNVNNANLIANSVTCHDYNDVISYDVITMSLQCQCSVFDHIRVPMSQSELSAHFLALNRHYD